MLDTKRRVIGQIVVCQGCCCGATHKDRPEVPVAWLKEQWRNRGLLKRVQLSVSGCVGPCDIPNVVVVNSDSGSQWLGNITQFNQYSALVDWATRSMEAGRLLELPIGLDMLAPEQTARPLLPAGRLHPFAYDVLLAQGAAELQCDGPGEVLQS